MLNRPSDIALPEGWTWERVEASRAQWGIADNMVPIAVVPGACVAWGTINSVRQTRDLYTDAEYAKHNLAYCGE